MRKPRPLHLTVHTLSTLLPASALKQSSGCLSCLSAIVALVVVFWAADGIRAQTAPSRFAGYFQQPDPDGGVRAGADDLIEEILEPQITMDLDPRRSKVIRTKRPVTRVSVTDPNIVEVTQFSPTEFELIGGNTGETSLTFWFGADGMEQRVVRYLIRVSPNEAIEDRRKIEYDVLERKLNELFPNSMIQLFPVANKLIVRGQARDAEEATQILSVLRGQGDARNAGQGAGFGGSVVQGRATEPFPGVSDLPVSDIVSLLTVPGEMQVMLKVRVAELSRTALRQMGSEFNVDAGDFTFDSLLGFSSPVSAVLDTDEVRLVLQALATNSYGKILAEPNLVTLSGHPASFIAGGEFAVPVVVGVEGAAAQTTNFRGFGTQLTFTPTVLDKDKIRMQVAPSVSELNQDIAVDGIPGLNTRAVATTVVLREGQWLAIAGLIQDQQSGSKTRVPLLGDVPVLDSVFSRKDIRREETELIVLVSPELIHPLEAEEAPLILPGMEVTEPGDWKFYLYGRIEGRSDCDHRSTVWPVRQQRILEKRREVKRHTSYQDCEGYYITGDQGFSR